ncbi:MAG: hypothetical protein ABI821_11365 [Pseudomonadota bacterium]
MFVVDRSALAVLLPLALLVGAVWWSNHSEGASVTQSAAHAQHEQQDQTVAANLPSR